METEPLLITDAEAAKILGVSRSTWWRLYAYKQAPLKIRICRMARWRRQEVIDWVLAGMPNEKLWRWRADR